MFYNFIFSLGNLSRQKRQGYVFTSFELNNMLRMESASYLKLYYRLLLNIIETSHICVDKLCTSKCILLQFDVINGMYLIIVLRS